MEIVRNIFQKLVNMIMVVPWIQDSKELGKKIFSQLIPCCFMVRTIGPRLTDFNIFGGQTQYEMLCILLKMSMSFNFFLETILVRVWIFMLGYSAWLLKILEERGSDAFSFS